MGAFSPVQRFLRYLSAERNASDATCRSYALDLRQFFQFLGHARPGAVSPLDIRRFIAHLSTQQRTKRTITRKLSCLRSFFRFLCREGVLTRNPAAAVPSPRAERRLPAFLDEAQMARLAQKGKIYNLIVGGDVVAECSEAVVKRLSQDMRDRLLGEGVEGGGMLAALALAGAVANEQMTLYPKAIAKMRGGANR